MIKTLIVDDEFPSLKILENFAQKTPDCELVGKCKSGSEALEFLENNEVDLLFLDIQMPDFTGLELLRKLKRRPVTVITTANHDKALDAYNLGVIDYLAKPFSFERFQQAVERAKAQLSYKKAADKESGKPDHIVVRSDYRITKIMLSEVRYIEGQGEYVKFVLGKNFIVTLESMKNLLTLLPKEDFVRIHKSYIVNANYVRSISGTYVEMFDATQLPIGKVFKDTARVKLNH